MSKKGTTAFLLLFSVFSFAQWQWRGTYSIEPGYQTDIDEHYFEQKLELSLRKNRWEMGFTYEQFDPAKPQSLMNEDEGLWHKYLDYYGDNLHLRLGTFYSIFGRGLVLKAYDHPAIGLDRRLQGVLVEYRHKFFQVKALKGDIYGIDREISRPITGAEVTLKPFSTVTIGKTFVKTDLQYTPDATWESWFIELNFDFVNFYGEHAKDNQEMAGTADYASLNLFLGPVSLLGEYKNYENYQKSDGLIFYNDPPTLVQEHRFILWNRHGYVINAWDETGYSVKLDSPLGEDGLLTLHHDFSEMLSGYDVFQESYGVIEWDFANELETVLIAGTQEDFGYLYRNLGIEFQFPLKQLNVGIMLEVQKRESIWVDSYDESQALTMDVTITPNHIVSLVAEHTSANESDKNEWIGVKYGMRWGENLDLTVFYGSRRKGKICAGGVCVYTPEFEGIEFSGTYRFGS